MENATWNDSTFLIIAIVVVLLGFMRLGERLVTANKTLQAQANRMKAFIDGAMDAFVQMDANGQVTGWNRRAEDLFGWKAEHAIGRPLHELIVPHRHREAHCNGLRRRVQAKPGTVTGRMVDQLVEASALRRHGQEFPVEIYMSEVHGVQGREFSAYIRDITQRNTQLKKLKLAASVFKHAREGITITDVHGNILDVNDMFTEITGYTAAEVIGKNPRILQSGRQDAAFYRDMWTCITEHGHWSGEIWNRRKNGEIYPEVLTISAVKDENGEASHYVALFSDITVIKNHQSHLEYLAHFDPLTELPNRVLMLDRLRQALLQAERSGQSVAVAYLDLDGFKEVNDRYGHIAGDRLLATMAERMRRAVRAVDTLARVGGDEFVAVLVGGEQDDMHNQVLRRVLGCVQDPVMHEGVALQVTASIGVTVYPTDSGDAEQLIRNADQAMYQAKRLGKNQIQNFDVVQDTSIKQHHERLHDIGQAIHHGQMVLYYQPKIDLLDGRIVGLEALVRWQHPDQGLLAPGAFLPDIEGHPLSIRLGEWVIAEALQQSRRWAAEGLPLPVSVNLSANHLQSTDLIPRLSTLLGGRRDDGLQIEILETSALDDLFSTRQLMLDASTLGLSFALDDFGTGYSSLSYLRHLPIQHIKIDQSFVRSMLHNANDRAIVHAIIGLARSFDIKVVAEGVETAEHAQHLRGVGCDIAQGYAIARPMPAGQLADWSQRWRHNGMQLLGLQTSAPSRLH